MDKPSMLIIPPAPIEDEPKPDGPGGRNCVTCEFFARNEKATNGSGVCHGAPPKAHIIGMGQSVVGRPAPITMGLYCEVGPGDWCRLWERRSPPRTLVQ